MYFPFFLLIIFSFCKTILCCNIVAFRNTSISTLKNLLLEKNFIEYSTTYAILFKKYITCSSNKIDFEEFIISELYDDFKQLLLTDWNITQTDGDNPTIYIFDLNTIIEYMLSIGIKPEDAYFFDDDMDEPNTFNISYYYVITMSRRYDDKEIKEYTNISYTDDYILYYDDDNRETRYLRGI